MSGAVCEHVFVRWENLEVGNETERPLPRLGADAVIRTFDAPEALDIRFHEVRAKSALNRVPKSSRMPFRWTINPYRGCSHACSYCSTARRRSSWATAARSPWPTCELAIDVYGTVRQGNYRRYAITSVLDHWSSTKPAYRIVLDDGTELVASGDHRFLSDRGWKHVTGAECRPAAEAAPDAQQQAHGRRTICHASRGHAGLQAGLSLRAYTG